MKNIIRRFNALFFKENLTCNLCGREVFNEKYFCPTCESSFEGIDSGAYCSTCGRRTTVAMERCFSCKENWQIDFARSAFVYENNISKLILDYKYNQKQYLANVFMPYLEKTFIANNFDCNAITFVPMNAERLFERGFNHSKLLAETFSKIMNIQLIAPLYKKDDYKKQVGLTAKERALNIIGSFGYQDKKSVVGKNVLLIDDVLTTGATSGEIAKMLKKAGSGTVSLLTVASVKSMNL